MGRERAWEPQNASHPDHPEHTARYHHDWTPGDRCNLCGWTDRPTAPAREQT